ncbi:Unknown protein, partial [Striga hermonthica]
MKVSSGRTICCRFSPELPSLVLRFPVTMSFCAIVDQLSCSDTLLIIRAEKPQKELKKTSRYFPWIKFRVSVTVPPEE